jgi:glycosyltransferase involved in cell wall biosynthesis
VRLVFDAYWWVEGPAALRHVLREIVLAWHEEFPDDALALVVRRRHQEAARRSIPEGIEVVTSRLRPQALLASIATERARRRLGFDVVLVHNFAARSRRTSAVYLHDAMFVTNPEWFTRLELAYFSRMVRWAPRADVVFTSTATEAERIRASTGAAEVVPVGLGLSTELVHSTQVEEVEGLEPGRFLLTVGRLNVRKNLERTVLGALASGQVTAERPLVVVGGAGGRNGQLHPGVHAAVEAGTVRFLGHVTEPQLRWLYRHTCLFLFLSLGEGFGMPPVEALYFGARVLASDLPVFHENLPKETVFVDPLSLESIAAGVHTAMASVPLDSSGRAEVARRHDWRSSVTSMRRHLALVLENGPHPPPARGER